MINEAFDTITSSKIFFLSLLQFFSKTYRVDDKS